MKQNQLGGKIQNWHRPVGPNELRRRYRQHRYDDPEITKRGRSLSYNGGTSSDRDIYTYDEQSYVSAEDISWAALRLFTRQLVTPPRPLIPYEWVSETTSNEVEQDWASVGTFRSSPNIEERLFSHLQKLSDISTNSCPIKYDIIDSIGGSRNVDLIKGVAEKFLTGSGFAEQVCLFSPFWVRSPNTWKGDDETSLLDHLFSLHKVPKFLYRQWNGDLNASRFKWLCWFILFGQGGSLKRAGDLFGWKVPSKFSHFLQDAPPEITPVEACLFAEVRRLCGSEIDFRRITQNSAFVIDPTEPNRAPTNLAFWYETIRWFITNSTAITGEQSELILEWAMHEQTEGEREGVAFSWKGRGAQTVIERSLRYHREQHHPYYYHNWDPHGWNWVLDDPLGGRWDFTELTTGEALFHEGEAMRHCVSRYSQYCVAGNSSIVSLSHNGLRCVTIEINPRTMQLVQARGACNREASSKESEAISIWIEAVVQADESWKTG